MTKLSPWAIRRLKTMEIRTKLQPFHKRLERYLLNLIDADPRPLTEIAQLCKIEYMMLYQAVKGKRKFSRTVLHNLLDFYQVTFSHAPLPSTPLVRKEDPPPPVLPKLPKSTGPQVRGLTRSINQGPMGERAPAIPESSTTPGAPNPAQPALVTVTCPHCEWRFHPSEAHKADQGQLCCPDCKRDIKVAPFNGD